MQASLAPHDENEEPIYPGTCRPRGCVVEAAVPTAGNEFAADTAASTQGHTGDFACRMTSESTLSMRVSENNLP